MKVLCDLKFNYMHLCGLTKRTNVFLNQYIIVNANDLCFWVT